MHRLMDPRRMTSSPPMTSPSRAAAGARHALSLWLFALAVLVAGCGMLPEVKDETASWSADRLYQAAHDALLDGNYTRAIKMFETLESRFPYGRYAQQAMLETAYANYRAGETAAAVAACDRFIRTYPNHPNVDYAYYLKGLVHFREDQGLLGYVYELDLSEREPKAMRESFAAFKELVTKFPDSRYAQDSIARMKYLTNALALYEVKVARYYFNRGAYVAAVNRAQGALTNYPRTPASEEALGIMVLAYEKLGLPQLSSDASRILQQTFPKSDELSELAGKPWWKFW
jgi:outer membrane protein assembly factor BamD